MNKKINVGLLFGGKSFEHEVSLLSARSVLKAIDRDQYDLTLIGIDKKGIWHFLREENHFIHQDNPEEIALGPSRGLLDPFRLKQSCGVDVIFPILHGPNGEDGTVQGLLELINIPYVGADVLGSSVGMDKDVMKRLLRDAGIPLAKFLTIYHHERALWSFQRVFEELSLPFFVKPANSGSSVGISKVHQESEFKSAMDDAFRYDRKIVIEKAITGSEIQCSVMGNEEPQVSTPCQIIPKGEFHSYSSKYLDPQGADFFIPAKICPEQRERAQELSLATYKILCCEGFARVDMFLSHEGEVIVSEINTIPGLTTTSPYAKMWGASGVSYSVMIDRLIKYAVARHDRENGLVTFIAPHEKRSKQHV